MEFVSGRFGNLRRELATCWCKVKLHPLYPEGRDELISFHASTCTHTTYGFPTAVDRCYKEQLQPSSADYLGQF
eukprot:1139847-Pelagomonas_calceolata.AAC.6